MNDRFGLLYDTKFSHDLADHHQDLDLLEIIPDRFFDYDNASRIPGFPTAIPTVFHSLNLSLGSDEALDGSYLSRLHDLAERFRPMWLSDHLAVSQVDGKHLGQLSPIRLSAAAVKRIASKIALIQDRLRLPFLIENITCYFHIPGAEMAEGELLRKLAKATGCSLLLDLNNVAVNATNHGFDPYAYLRDFPLHAVSEIHIAGNRKHGNIWLDSHAEPVGELVWDLLRFVAGRVEPVNVILERDQDIPPCVELLRELATARRCVIEGRRDRLGVPQAHPG